jgi:hypothetical protein
MREDFTEYLGEIERGLKEDREEASRPDLGASPARSSRKRHPAIRELVPG